MAKLSTGNQSAKKIDEEKIEIEAKYVSSFKRIFRNIATDAKNIYAARGYVDAQEIADNYNSEFVKEIRDLYRFTIKRFGFRLRESLESSKYHNFNTLEQKSFLDIEQKATISIDDTSLDDNINNINNSFNVASTLFISNQSENQSSLIAQTNAKELNLAVDQEREFFARQVAQRQQEIFDLQSRIETLPEGQRLRATRQLESARRNLSSQLGNQDTIIAENIRKNLLDRSQSRADLISSQNVGTAESWSRQTEAELVDDAGLVSPTGDLITVTKTWIAILDDKTRINHASADLQQVGINETFTVGGESLRFPRDPNGSAGNIINCRCVSEQGFNEQKAFLTKSVDDIDLKPTEAMARNAKRGLEWRDKYGRGGTAVGVARARDISNRKNLSPETVGRMVSYFARHEVDKEAEGFRQGEEGFPSAGKIAWCLTHDTDILLSDGSLKSIGDIVNNKLEVEVIALHKDGTIRPAKVINWLKKESSREEFMVLRRGNSKSNERGVVRRPKIIATKDHPIFIGKERGYVKMQDLCVEDKVAVVEQFVDSIGEQIIAGHLLGDAYLTEFGQISITRCENHRGYLEDTIRILKNLKWSKIREHESTAGFGAGKKSCRSISSVNHFLKLGKMVNIVNKKRVLVGDLNRLGSIGFARWIMDDGSLYQSKKGNCRPTYRLHIEGFDEQSASKIHLFFLNKYGDDVKIHKRENTDGHVVYFGANASELVANEIAPFICDSMKYKLPENLRNVDYALKDYVAAKTFVASPQKINYIRSANKSDGNSDYFKYRYDLTIEGAHSFVANGIIVHNSLWGGDEGKTWADRKWKQIKKERESN